MSHKLRPRKATLWFGAMLIMLGALALAGCGGSSAAAKPTATPSAQSILAQVNKVNYKDGSFTVTLTGTSSGTTFTATGTGTFTTTPSRTSFNLNADVSGQQVAIQEITDDATSSTYTLVPSESPLWSKSAESSDDNTGSIGNFTLTNGTLVGTEQLNGTSVYHLQGQDTTDSTATDDIYVRTDNYQPVRLISKSSDSSVTVDFTQFNTGVTITLPPADQVQS